MASLLLFLLALSGHCSWVLADSSTTTGLLWPLPKMATFGTAIYSFEPTSFQFLGSGAGGSSATLKGAFERYIQLIFDTPVPFYPSGAGGAATGVLNNVEVTVKSSSETPGPDTDESCESPAPLFCWPKPFHSLFENQKSLLKELFLILWLPKGLTF